MTMMPTLSATAIESERLGFAEVGAFQEFCAEQALAVGSLAALGAGQGATGRGPQ